MGQWLAGFHTSFDYQLCRGDANARNFLISSSGVVGVDFEESVESDTIHDLGQVCSSILSMHPMFTKAKIRFCSWLAGAYFSSSGETRMADMIEATAVALENSAAFRSDGRLMRMKAAEFRNTGIWSGEE